MACLHVVTAGRVFCLNEILQTQQSKAHDAHLWSKYFVYLDFFYPA